MKIGEWWYPVQTLGYGNRIGIWVQGCSRQCDNCISPEFKSYNGGYEYDLEKIKRFICNFDKVDGLTVSGGEPFDQPKELFELVEWFSSIINDDILIFTGYTLEELHMKNNEYIERVLDCISVLIDGEYIDDLNNGMGLRGSVNQRIHIWKNHDRYDDLERQERKMQCVFLKNRMWIIGIPPK